MNNDKAKEFFSSYAEGTLDAGLRQSFEAQLHRDRVLDSEYRDFERTLEHLGQFKFEDIEVPADLNERISARLDRHVYDRKQNATPSWHSWLRNAAMAGVAAAAIFGAIISVRAPHAGGVSGASVVPGLSSSEQITFKARDNGWVEMAYKPSSRHTVVIRSFPDKVELRRVDVTSEGWINTLKNSQPHTTLFSIQVDSEAIPALLAVPGTARETAKTGSGSISDMAKALAGFYRVPVRLQAANLSQSVNWSFDSPEPGDAASHSLDAQKFSVDSKTSGIVWISETP